MSIFKVIYDSNCGSSDSMEVTTVVYGQLNHLNKNQFQRKGYWFKGWHAFRVSDQKMCYENIEGTKRFFYIQGQQPEGWKLHLYKDGAGVAKLSKIDDDVIVMYAQWEKEKSIISCAEHSEENKQILKEKLLKKQIVLFGAGDRCKNFYQKYHKVLNIRCILTDKKTEKEIVLKDGSVIKVEQYHKNKILPNDYIIVCRPVKIWFDEEYENAKKVLVRDGFCHIEDFVRIGIAKMLLENKKLWLWMGFCQFDTLRDIFGSLNSIKQDFVMIGTRVGKDTIKTSYKFDDCKDMLKICDVLIYTPLIFSEGKVDFDYNEYIAKDTKAYSLPRIAFRGYYPYKDHDIDIHHKYTYDGALHWPFSYAENYLDELIKKGLSDDEIYTEVMREDFIAEDVIKKNLKLAYKSIEISEKTADIQILDYIKENLNKRLLYRDGLHYQNFMYFELARRLSKKLNFNCVEEIDELERQIEAEGTQYIDFTEIPILPCVAKTLNLDFVTDETLWRVKFTQYGKYRGTEHQIRMLTRKEWIYNYISYTRAQMTLCDIWNKKGYEQKGKEV